MHQNDGIEDTGGNAQELRRTRTRNQIRSNRLEIVRRFRSISETLSPGRSFPRIYSPDERTNQVPEVGRSLFESFQVSRYPSELTFRQPCRERETDRQVNGYTGEPIRRDTLLRAIRPNLGTQC